MSDTETVLLGVGTSACRMALRAMRALPDRSVHAVLGGCESAADVGVHDDPERVFYEQLPSATAVHRTITDRPEDFPWMGPKAVEHVAWLAKNGGRGVGGSPSAGRAAFALGVRAIYERLADIGRDAQRRRRVVKVLLVVNTAGGTSRGSLLEIGLLAKVAIPGARRRMLLVLPHFGSGAHPHELIRRARNAYTALSLMEEGMVARPRPHRGPFGPTRSEPTTLADEVLVVAPRYQMDDRANVHELDGLPEIEIAVARILEGIAGGAPAWRFVEDRLIDQDEPMATKLGTEERPRFQWLAAGNEGRIWYDEARVRVGVEAGVIGEQPNHS